MRAVIILTLGFLLVSGWAAETGGGTDLHGDPLPPKAVTRLGTGRFRTTGEIQVIAISPDSRWLAWGGESGMRVCEAATGKPLFSAHGPGADDEAYVYALEFSPDGGLLLFGSDTGDLALRDLKTGQTRKLSGHEDAIQGVAFSRDGLHAASFDEAGRLILWDVAQGLALRKGSSKEGTISAVAFSADGGQLACGLDDGKIILLDTGTFDRKLEARGLGDAVRALTFSPDGNRLASAGDDGSIRVWHAQDLRPIWAGETSDLVSRACWSRDGATILMTDEEGYVRLWDASTGRSEQRFLVGREPYDTCLYALAVSPDGKTIYCGGDTGHLSILDTTTGRTVEPCEGHYQPATLLTFSSDGRSLASSSQDGSVRVWDVMTGRQKFTRPLPLIGETRPVFSPDGKRVACAGSRVLHLWDTETGAPLGFAQGAFASNGQLVCAPDGRGVLTLGASGLTHWTFENLSRSPIGSVVDKEAEREDDADPLQNLRLAFDGRTVLAVGNKVRCIDLATGRSFSPQDFEIEPTGLAVSPDGRWLASHSEDGLAIWETASFKRMRSLRVENTSTGAPLAFSPDNRLLLVGSTSDACALLLDPFSGKQVGRLSAGEGYFVSAETSPDGRWLALSHSDTTILIYPWEQLAPKRPTAAEEDQTLETAFTDLADEPGKAYTAIGRLLQSDASGIAFLDARLKPVRPDLAALEALVKDLNNDDFAVREKTTTQLLGLGLLAEARLRRAREEAPSREVKERLDAILEELSMPIIRSKELLRTLRVIGILESMGSAEAQAVLQRVAADSAEGIDGQAAQEALKRLARRVHR